ncbi:MAG: EAL domain-containing protein [Lachnospiraceae bacterium]|nr:EAL domain-containing protein [Butyrivibrio sp.]MCM1342382.1 EAL domain-containing protein [Muribaculaceae bacterium]MCM1409275.1 EAL domain-containing protein [Lachnospiraceae bacterium]
MTHKEKADMLLRQQYHCSQALFGAFAEDFGLDLQTAFKVSTCFGAGMRQGDICGCVSASLMVLGMAFGFYDAQDREQEMYGNQKTREFMERFRERMNGDVMCRDILAHDVATPEGMKIIKQAGLILKNCPRPINHSIDILEEMLAESTKEESGGNDKWSLENLTGEEEMRALMEQNNKKLRFHRNVNELLFSSRKPIAFIQFDIRRFKIINDLYGERFGDEVLYFIRNRLKEICSEHQYFLNLRSDVFMIVTEFGTEEELLAFVHQVDDAVSTFKNVQLQLSYGIYIVEDKDMEQRQMEDRAAMARKSAKEDVMSNIIFYQTQFKELLYSRKFIEEGMQAAIDGRQFKMYLQPKYSIAKSSIVGAEALVRWIHPERGMIYPNEFIPILEENGFIRQVDYFIWSEAADFIRRCSDVGITDCPVSVNVSRIHLQDDVCQKVLRDIIADSGIKKELLELEITETMNDQQISQKAYELKGDGFRLLMDDFGSGYSSLNILLETPFDVIKLDKKFIENMMLSDKGKLILEQVVTMAQKLELGLLAEGVETADQVDTLRRIGCDLVQGYYYAKPMPAEDFFALLKEDRGIVG